MIHHHCIVSHEPPKSYGDCLRACVASILNIERVEDVPHFMHDGDDERGNERLKEYLWTQGLRPFITALGGETTLSDVFTMMNAVNTDIPYLLFCQCGGGHHVVICRNDKIIHNPAWINYPIEGPTLQNDVPLWVIMVFVPLFGDT